MKFTIALSLLTVIAYAGVIGKQFDFHASDVCTSDYR
jgi:hypothetical protein